MASKKDEKSIDEEIRKLVVARLSVLSSDTIKAIGNKGVFTRDELIEHVNKGDEIGETVKNIEMEWLKALKSGIVKELYG